MIPKNMTLDRIKMTRAQRRTILRHPAVESDLATRADRIRDSAGGGYTSVSSTPTKRSRAAVFASGPEAAADNAHRNTLVRSLDAGRSV